MNPDISASATINGDLQPMDPLELSETTPATVRERYHHGDLRQQLMEAAVRSIADHGAEKLSLRALARAAGVSATAPYRHFESRAALLAELARAGFVELGKAVGSATRAHPGDPLRALLAGGVAYVTYARENPVPYQLMFSGIVGDFAAYPGLREAADESYGHVYRVLEEGITLGVFRDDPLVDLAATVWAGVHGVASLLNMKEPMEAPGNPTDHPGALAMNALARIHEDTEGILRRLSIDGVLAHGHLTPTD